MKYFWLLIPLFLFSCKKKSESPQVLTSLQPVKMGVYSVDPGTGVETLQYDIRYFYNDSASRYDSIVVGGKSFRFDYSQFNSNKKLILNYNANPLAYDEINLDASFFTIANYKEVR